MNDFITVKSIVDENFQDYKKASMFIAFPKCDFKCFQELGLEISGCQNYGILKMPDIKIKIDKVFERYVKNPITEAVILGGLEPFFNFDEVYNLISYFRQKNCNDDFVIYTGYYPNEVENYVEKFKKFKNIIIKFGRFIPKSASVFDKILGVKLASKNQFAEKIS
jgi:organic radical activating enzyme